MARRSVTVRRNPEAGAVSVRAGDKVLGSVVRLQTDEGVTMSGGFTHSPAYADFTMLFARLERAIADGQPTDAIYAELEAKEVQVWHSVHEMRIDRPNSIVIAQGQVRFVPNDSFVMMRTGGL